MWRLKYKGGLAVFCFLKRKRILEAQNSRTHPDLGLSFFCSSLTQKTDKQKTANRGLPCPGD
jgi:hypothetical protein